MIARVIEVRKVDIHLYCIDLESNNNEEIIKMIKDTMYQGHSIVFSPNSTLREKIANKLDMPEIDT